MTEREFYDLVAGLIGTTHEYTEPREYMRRWGPRTPGNGRYPGHGIVRVFSPDNIHVALHTPAVSGTFKNYDAALAAIIAAIRPVQYIKMTDEDIRRFDKALIASTVFLYELPIPD